MRLIRKGGRSQSIRREYLFPFTEISPYPNSYSGVETLLYSAYGTAYDLAININEQLERIGFQNLGVNERPNLVVLRDTSMPAVLVEVGFINTTNDNWLLDSNFEDVAAAIADGIMMTVWNY